MGDIEEDLKEVLITVDAHVEARAEVVNARWGYWEGSNDKSDMERAEASETKTREKMIKTLRAFIDPRTCP